MWEGENVAEVANSGSLPRDFIQKYHLDAGYYWKVEITVVLLWTRNVFVRNRSRRNLKSLSEALLNIEHFSV